MLIEAENSLTDMAMAAMSPNATNPGDETLLVKFYLAPIENPEKSKEAGRPIFDEIEWVSISSPGSRNCVERPARNTDKTRFPRHYAAFQARESQENVSGTLLSEWPGATRSQVEELKFLNIVTVEQLAGIPDSNTQNMMGLVTLKDKAVKYLEASKDLAASAALTEAKAEIAELKEQMAALIAAQDKPKPKRRRRTKAEIESDAETSDSE